MNRKLVIASISAAVLGLAAAAGGIPATNLNSTAQNEGEGIVVPAGGNPVGIVISPAVFTAGEIILSPPGNTGAPIVVTPGGNNGANEENGVVPVGGTGGPPSVIAPLGPISMAPGGQEDGLQFGPGTPTGGDDFPAPAPAPVATNGGNGGGPPPGHVNPTVGPGTPDGGDTTPTGPTMSILEQRPDFLYVGAQRLFEAQSTRTTGQKRLGVAPGLSQNGPRYVPLGEF